jgi:hypothetical protein
MGLSRLDNFLKSVRGTILYVDPNSLDSTDSIENQGNSLTRPFKTIQRALLEASRFSYQRGLDNDRFNKTTILLYPGDHIVDNRPGYIPLSTGQFLKRSSSPASDFSPFDLTTNFDLTTENNSLYKLNSVHGGVIIPRGTSIVGMDLRKTKIRPTYVPNPENDQIERSCVFRVTGACYLWQFTILDADPNQICYKDYTSNIFVPNFSHHKLAGFEYADGVNPVSINDDFITPSLFSPDGRTDLDMYYDKVGIAYGTSSGRPIEPDYPSSVIDIQPVIDEYRIVGSRGTTVGISSIRAGDGVTGTTTITLDFVEATDQFNVDTPIQISGVGAPGYDGMYVVNEVLSSTQIQYQVQNTPLNPLPGVAGATISISVDTVTSASPYIFNVSLRSVYGMCGLLADGSKAAGFKSMVVAQYTGIGLQKDDNAFVKYDIGSGTYLNTASVSNIHSDSRARFKPSYENFHIKATNNAYLQLVSVFAIGFAEHFVVESGGDFSINNSNSNFGAKALSASGFRQETFPKDDVGYITHIIPPKEIENAEVSINYLALDVATIVSAATTSRLYLYNETNSNTPPAGILDGYRIGARNNDSLYLQISQSEVTTEYSARIVVPNNGVVLDQNSSEKTFNVSNINGNIVTLNSPHSFINGESIRIISENGDLPGNIINNQIYYAITKEVATGIGSTQIQIAQTLNDALNNTSSEIYYNGGNPLTIVSRVSDKNTGDIGHPIQYDTTQNNWYVNVATAATSNTIYPTIKNLGTAGLGNATPRTYIKRTPVTRNLIDSVYRIRYVLPKGSPTTARPPLDGYIIQESNNTIGAGTTEIVKYFSPTTATLSNSSELRNPRFIANANWSNATKTANIITELPHDLTVGAQVEVLNIISTNNPAGVANSAYNGTFTVSGISSTKQFSYSVTNDPGTFTNNTSSRTSSLPRFNHKKLSGTYYIYRSEEIKKYIPNVQDGIYHLVVVNSSNSPTVAPFTDLRFSQPLQNLYPQTNRDNPTSDPQSAKSYALPNVIGQVVVNEPQNSITKETVERSLVDFNVGIGITNIVSSSGIAHTLYTTIDHGLCGVTSVSITNGGSGYVTGTYYNARLTGAANGVNATARVTVSGGAVTAVCIMDGGSAYVVGNTASLAGLGTVGSGATVTIANIYNNVGDCLSLSGVSSAAYVGYNTLYRISGISTAKQITVQSSEAVSGFNTTGLGVTITANANVLLTGKTLGISTFTYNSTTNVGVVTFTSAHGLLINNKVRLTGFDNSSYNGDYLVKNINSLKTSISINVGVTTTALSIGAGSTAYIPALTSYGGDLDVDTESTSGRLITEYAGITTTLGVTVSAQESENSAITIPNAVVLGLNIGDYLQIDNEIFRINTTVTDNSIYAFRGLFATPRQQHNAGSIVRRIKVLPIELRRNSIIRASGHTFEYLGYGPGNYSTAFPERQDRSLSYQEILLAQSTKTDGGVNVYTGMDDKGNFFTGNKKINSATGQEEVYDAPIPTVTGEDPTINGNFGFDVRSPLQISVNRSIKVEGGTDGNLISEFDGPVVFNNKITSTSQKGLEVKSLFVQGDQTVPRKYTIGIATPSLAGNPGDVVYNAFPNSSDYIGWVYTSNNLWEKFGKIGLVDKNSIGISSNNSYVGLSTLINFKTSGITLNSQYNATTGITTLTFTGTGPKVTTIGVSTSTSNTFAGVGTQINFVGTNIGINAKTDTASGITTVNLVGLGTTSIYSGLKFIKTDGQSTGGVPNILRVDGTDSKLQSGDVFNALGYIPAQSSQTSNYPTGNSIVLDSIGSQFNGTLTDFGMKYVGVAYTPFGSSANLIVSLGGVIQKPGLDFSIVQGTPVSGSTSNTSTIRFTTAPTAGLSDFIVSLGGQGILLQDPAWDAKGDLIVGTGNDAATKLPTGTTDQVLSVDTTTFTGLKWRTLTIPDAQVQTNWNATSGLGVILNKPSLATVATSGNYNDLSNKPSLATVATSGNYNDLSNKPSLATVATSGNYNDLSNKPSIPAAQVQTNWDATSGLGVILNKPSITPQIQSNWAQTTTSALDYIKNKPTLATVATTGSYNNLSNTPTIPVVNNGQLTIATNGTGLSLTNSGGTNIFTANQSGNNTITLNSNATDAPNYIASANTLVSRDATGSFGVHELRVSRRIEINNTTLPGGGIASNGGIDGMFDIFNKFNGGKIILTTNNSSGLQRGVQFNYDGVTIPGILNLTGGGEAGSGDLYVDGGSDGIFVIYNTRNGGAIHIAPRGDAGINKASIFEKTGNLSLYGTLTQGVSDERLKTNIKPLKNSLDKVLSLSGFTYNYNEVGQSLGFSNESLHVGVSAQEVQLVLPEAVAPAPADKEYLTVKYEKLVPLLIEAIKELTQRVTELENK